MSDLLSIKDLLKGILWLLIKLSTSLASITYIQ